MLKYETKWVKGKLWVRLCYPFSGEATPGIAWFIVENVIGATRNPDESTVLVTKYENLVLAESDIDEIMTLIFSILETTLI